VRAKGWLAVATVGCLLGTGAVASADAPIHLVINGQEIVGADAPVLLGDTTYVPLRLVATALGASVGWDDATRTASVLSPPTPAADQAASLSALVARVEPSIVGVVAVQHDATGAVVQVSSGSGVVIGPNGLVVTNDHVLEGGDTYYVVTDSRQALQVPGSAIWADSVSDLAFLRTGDASLPPATLGDSSQVQVGESVFTIGNPLGAELADTVTRGVVSGVGRVLSADAVYPVLQTDAAINPGNSGGALVDMSGAVIGITSEKLSGSELQGLGFAKPSNLVKQILASFQQNGYVVRAWLGVQLSDPWQVAYGLPTSDGPTVAQVVAGGPAAEAGVLPGDEILAIGGTAVHSQADLEDVINATAVGATLPLTLSRGGQTIQVQVTLQQRPQQ
jgi:serine protease Do